MEKLKTGTTCIGVKYKDGVLLAGDKRVSMGSMIAYSNMTKVIKIADNIGITTAGEVASIQLVLRHIQKEIKLIEYKNERKIRVKEVISLINSIQYNIVRSQGSIIGYIIGGFDDYEGFTLMELSPDGSLIENCGYVADGSGSIFVKPILQNEYKENMSQKEAIDLIEKCYKTSFKNDSGSGDGYIILDVTKKGTSEVVNKSLEVKK